MLHIKFTKDEILKYLQPEREDFEPFFSENPQRTQPFLDVF